MLGNFQKYVEAANGPQLDELLSLVAAHCPYAVIWKRLLVSGWHKTGNGRTSPFEPSLEGSNPHIS